MIQFKCQDNRVLVGNRTITCENDGFFTAPEFSCKNRAVLNYFSMFFLFLKKQVRFQYRKRCHALPSVDLASPIIINEEFSSGSVVSYKCVNQMSRPTGDPTIVCDENGKWSDIQFTCDRNSVTKFAWRFIATK